MLSAMEAILMQIFYNNSSEWNIGGLFASFIRGDVADGVIYGAIQQVDIDLE